MTFQADLLERAVAQPLADDEQPLEAARWRLAFQPEVFFLGRTEGAGLVRDPLGRIVRRCSVTTQGQINAARGSLELEEVYAYDDGEIDVWRWAMTAGRDGRYVVAEAKAGVASAAERQGDDYLVVFRRPYRRATGAFAPRYAARFSLLSADTTLKRADISLYGVPLGSLTAVHRKVEG
ncbi:MAG TPA: DUF3833 family protein [Caulobacteraceae bacterium]